MQLLHIFLVGYLPIIAWTVALDQGSSKRHHHTSLDRRAGDDIKRSLWLERLTPDSDDSYAIGWALPIDVGPYFGDPDFPDNEGLKLNFDTGSSKVWVMSTLLAPDKQTIPGDNPQLKRKMYLPPDEISEELCSTEEYHYGSGGVRVKVWSDADVVIDDTLIEDFRLGLADDIFGNHATWSQSRLGDGIMRWSPASSVGLMKQLDLDDGTQFLFDGEAGVVQFGDFGQSGDVAWIDVVPLRAGGDEWTAPGSATSIGSTLFDTGQEAIAMRPDLVDDYFAKEEWDGHVTTTATTILVDCNAADVSGLQDAQLEIQMHAHVAGSLEWQSFNLDVEFLIGEHAPSMDTEEVQYCVSNLQLMQQDSSSGPDPLETILGIPFMFQYDIVFDTGSNGQQPRIGIRNKQG